MDMAGCVGRTVYEKERFSHAAVLPHRFVGIMSAPVFMYPMLDLFYIEVRGDFLHKTPLPLTGLENAVREEMLVPLHKVVFLPLMAGAFPAPARICGPRATRDGDNRFLTKAGSDQNRNQYKGIL
jgi:hypothetical protein